MSKGDRRRKGEDHKAFDRNFPMVENIPMDVRLSCDDCGKKLSNKTMEDFKSIAEIRRLRYQLTIKHKDVGQCKPSIGSK